MNACIELDRVSLKYGFIQALDEVSATVAGGEIVGLIGRNGAGKTTLLETLAGVILPDSGCSRVLGHASRDLPDEARQRIGFVFQEDELFGWMRVVEHIDVVGAHYRNWDRERALDLARRWGVRPDHRVSALSRGQRQKLAILLAIVHRPEVLLLDEPASALDPVARREFLAELVELVCDRECTVLLSSHLLGDIERLASRIWLMRSGRLIIDEPLDQLKDGVIRLSFPAEAGPAPVDLPAVLARTEHDWGTVVVTRHPGEDTLNQLKGRWGPGLSVSSMNLEEIALELL